MTAESKPVQKAGTSGNFKVKTSRYVQKASLPDISHIAALFVGQSTAMWDCPPAEKKKEIIQTIQKDPCDYKGHTHTHTPTHQHTLANLLTNRRILMSQPGYQVKSCDQADAIEMNGSQAKLS